MQTRRGERLGFRLLDEHLPIRTCPGRNAVPPPELARDAPGLDIAHPLEIGLRPVLRREFRLAALDGVDSRLRKSLGVDVPLVGQIGLDHHPGPVAERLRDELVLNLPEQP